MKRSDWLSDLPQQFQGKKNIEILIQAISRQINELEEVYGELEEKTTLDHAEEANLDMIGTIACLNRSEAYQIINATRDQEIVDDLYRSILRYQILKNTGDCTYSDMQESLHLLWDTDLLRYVEDPDYPAMIFLKMPMLDIDEIDPMIGKVLIVKPAGVGVLFTVGYYFKVSISGLEKVKVNGICMKFNFPWWNFRTFDGTWNWDGTYLLNSTRANMKMRVEVGPFTCISKEIINMEA